MRSWYLAVYKNKICILDAVALNERGMKSTLNDFKIMLEKGADSVLFREYLNDEIVKEEIFKGEG